MWLILTGRGWGKTRTGSEWVRGQVAAGKRRVALVGPTAADVRDTMVEGPAGILACCTDGERPLYEPSKRRLTWPNGAVAITYSADEPERLRGPEHDAAWCDELAAWRRMQEAWDQLQFGLRAGDNPRVVVTTTPKPLKLLIDLSQRRTTHVTRGRTYDNLENLAPQFADEIVGKYRGTRLGRQELDGELLEDVEGALWQRRQIDALRVANPPEMVRVVIAIDPAVTSGEDSDETGIVAVGQGYDGRAYVLRDWSCRESPAMWARRAVALYDELKADVIVAEVNNGGALVEHTLHTVRRGLPYRAVHASRGKMARAEPVAALYEQGRVSHVGRMDELEDQMCVFVPGLPNGSPDRVDALVWAITELVIDRYVANLSRKPEGL